METKSLLVILSHVVHGYVGTRATQFPLQFYGWDVDSLNTTNFSNHPGYGKIKGSVASMEEIREIYQGLEAILDVESYYDIILTGYVPSASSLKEVYKLIVTSTKRNPGSRRFKWILDPVLGDNGKLYVLEDIVPVYKLILGSGLVSLTTPNQFEFELLSKKTIIDMASLKEAFDSFTSYYDIPYVVLSSVVIGGTMYCVGFSRGAKDDLFCIPINQIPCSFNGSGDLFTALLANAFHENNYVLDAKVLRNVLEVLHDILWNTYNLALERSKDEIKVIKDINIIELRHVLLKRNVDTIPENVLYL